jgi:hypothetical protein
MAREIRREGALWPPQEEGAPALGCLRRLGASAKGAAEVAGLGEIALDDAELLGDFSQGSVLWRRKDGLIRRPGCEDQCTGSGSFGGLRAFGNERWWL